MKRTFSLRSLLIVIVALSVAFVGLNAWLNPHGVVITISSDVPDAKLMAGNRLIGMLPLELSERDLRRICPSYTRADLEYPVIYYLTPGGVMLGNDPATLLWIPLENRDSNKYAIGETPWGKAIRVDVGSSIEEQRLHLRVLTPNILYSEIGGQKKVRAKQLKAWHLPQKPVECGATVPIEVEAVADSNLNEAPMVRFRLQIGRFDRRVSTEIIADLQRVGDESLVRFQGTFVSPKAPGDYWVVCKIADESEPFPSSFEMLPTIRWLSVK
jgi:hypothetical protein